MEKDYIQLPPLDKNTDSKVVRLLWEYIKIPDHLKDIVKKELDTVLEVSGMGNADDLLNRPKAEKIEELEPYHEAIKEMYADCMREACQLACWVYKDVIVGNRSVEEMQEEYPEAADLIYVASVLLQREEDMQERFNS